MNADLPNWVSAQLLQALREQDQEWRILTGSRLLRLSEDLKSAVEDHDCNECMMKELYSELLLHLAQLVLSDMEPSVLISLPAEQASIPSWTYAEPGPHLTELYAGDKETN